ncbi:MAG: argininosuccinate lyase [Rhodospirillaceae bacterium]|nr:argininosuccinate lyase [Rhodospirillaceae bacterium]MAX64305.1 argininosuccinate lyase [Rhodospirillaceae bacterium]MBB58219.1 argininosuccinate lyase [Rhodospirillaceae bacterium]|tara:strand:- start:6210 stop:7577 length:1368 start_codon:yes stop_codon:yes gene_type:complete
MWGGRFSGGPAEIMEKINASIGFDKNLYKQDIQGSLAHSDMLAAQGIITTQDRDAIHQGLAEIQQEIEAGTFDFKTELEDIHMNVEARLREKIGDPGARLHTGRSRNDQVITDVRLWTRDALDGLDALMADLQRALIDKAEAHADVLMPGYTHLQSAQPVTFGHHLMAYVEMVGRDRGRLADCRKRLNECPLGAAALAGTSFPIDRHRTAKALGFDRPTANSMDSVGSRDFILEFLAAGSIHAIHLSRLAEEIVMWMSDRFAFITLSDAFTTGSSIMPQKKNPDAAELVRAKPGRLLGAFISVSTMMKGLPMTFCKDMQEDKEPLFDAVESLTLAVAATAGMVDDMQPRPDRMMAGLEKGFPTATDLADWCVRVLNLPFRDAHHVTGALVAKAEARGVDLAELSLEEMQSVEKRITSDIYSVLSPAASVASRTSFGGTAPSRVREAAAAARKQYL